MKFTELKDSLKEGAACIYLLEGEDAYFRRSGEQMIKSAFLTMPELNFAAFDGENLKGAGYTELAAAVKNYPVMAEKRIVKVSELYPSENDYEKYLKPLFEDFPPTTILLIVNAGGRRGVELKRKKQVTYVNCAKAEPESVQKWIYITLKRAGVVAPISACVKIAEYCLNDMSRVAVEVDKIIAYKGGAGELAAEEVDALVFKDAEYRLYELTNTVPRRDYSKFCEIADELLKKGGDELLVLNGLLNFFKTLLTVMTARGSNAAVGEQFKMKEFAVKKSREQAAAMGEDRLKKLISSVYGAVSDIKGGRITPKSAYLKVRADIFFS